MAAQKSLGVILRKTSGTPMTIADLTQIGEIGGESEEIDVTTLDSSGGYKEYIPSFKDGGEVPFAGIIKSAANMEALLALFEAQSIETWEVEFPNGDMWSFSAFVKMFKEGESTVESVRTFTGAIRITGAPSYESAEESV